jgi:hypothetical protein
LYVCLSILKVLIDALVFSLLGCYIYVNDLCSFRFLRILICHLVPICECKSKNFFQTDQNFFEVFFVTSILSVMFFLPLLRSQHLSIGTAKITNFLLQQIF